MQVILCLQDVFIAVRIKDFQMELISTYSELQKFAHPWKQKCICFLILFVEYEYHPALSLVFSPEQVSLIPLFNPVRLFDTILLIFLNIPV